MSAGPTDRRDGSVEYVMVPVPQDLHARVMQYVEWRTVNAGTTGWDSGTVATLYEDLDEPSRTLLTRVARGVIDDEPVTLGAVASAAGISTREALGIVLELVHRFTVMGGPTFPLVMFDAAEGSGDDQRPIVMPKEGAQVVVSLTRVV
jgi:hypothetical protein